MLKNKGLKIFGKFGTFKHKIKVGENYQKHTRILWFYRPCQCAQSPPPPTPLSVHQAAGRPACLPVWHLCKSQRREQPRRVVLFCLWEPSCATLLCPGPEPSPIVCCHMEVSSNTEISLSSCCSLTFSGTQLALNGKIYNYPRYPVLGSASSLCVGDSKGGRCLVGGGAGLGVGFFLF